MNKFITKLIKEEKITLIDPSEEIAESYHQKSRNSLKAAEILITQDLLEEATSMTYYSMYNKATALLYLVGIKCENHTGTIILLKEIFEIDNKEIKDAKKERIDKQYYTEFKISKEQVEQQIETTKEFTDQLNYFIENLTEEQKKQYKERLEEYF
ncbi:MAG: HEPN domain-containing protein [Nanoarchaeota archaeon]|nr:HEPN domain-containing protein [Nanoarchaeota archaeon]